MKDRFSNPGVAGIALIGGAAGTLAAGQYAVALSLAIFALVCIAFFHKPKNAGSTPETSDSDDRTS
jgi:hypothetical protein